MENDKYIDALMFTFLRTQKISVIIPTHNRREILFERALPSVLNQTYKNIEVIVACHGCTDGTYEDLVNLGDPRIKPIEVPLKRHYPDTPRNRWYAGPVQPLNAALKRVNGYWIARIDDDDVWMPGHLEVSERFACDGEYDFVSSRYSIEINPKDKPIIVEHDGGDPPIGGTQTWLWRSFLSFMKWNPDCWRKDWDAVNDTDLAQRMRDADVCIGHHQHIGCVIRPRPGETKVGLAAYEKKA